MIGTFALGWLLAGLAAGPTVLFDDALDENVHHWQLDAQWQFHDGCLNCTGLAGEVLAVGCQGPAVGDGRFILRLHPTAAAPNANAGCGLLYRFNPASRDGCFVVVGPAGTFGFGRITGGSFALVKRGVSKAIVLDQGKPLELELRGDQHTLKCGGDVVGTWTEAARENGAFGLLVVDALAVAFEDLRVEALGPGAGRTALGPFPPSSAPAPTAAEGPLPAHTLLAEADVLTMLEWRRHYNRMAAALGQPPLPEKLDGVDLAVLAFLKYRHVSGVSPPAEALAEVLQRDELVAAGASGSAPEAALDFWLSYAAAPVEPDLVGGQEDLLAGLTWYFAARAKGAREWGTRGDYPLVVSNDLQKRLIADHGRFEVQVPNREAREARMTEVVRLEAQVREMTVRLGKGSGAP